MAWGQPARRLLLPLLLWACGLPAGAADAALPANPATPAEACPSAPAMPKPEDLARWRAGAQDRGFLWRIRGQGHDSWLYGTVHVGRAEWSFPGPHLLAALQGSRTVALEMDLLDPDISRRMTALAGRYAGRWPASLLARAQALAAAACLPASLLAQLHPAMLLSTLSAVSLRSQQLEVAYAPEFVLSGYAHARQLPVVSLESPELQARVLLGGGPPQAATLADGLQELESGRAATLAAALVKDWEHSDWEHLQDYASWCDCLRTPADRAALRKLVEDRNPGLAQGIDRLHRKGQPVLVAVGALHMIGPRGLPALLQQRGYTVELVPPAP